MPEQAADTPAPVPILVSWNLTRLCNLACGHCYLDAVQRRREAEGELTTDEALGIVEQLAALAPGAMLVFTGGEPLLRRDLDALVGAAARQGLMPVIGTNGTLLDEARAAALRAAGAQGVGISLDSTEPPFHDRLRGRRGAWAAAMQGIATARRAGLAVLLQTTVFEENRGELPGLAELAEVHGAVAFNLFFLVCTGRGVTQTDLAPEAYEATLAQILRLQGEHPQLKIRARCAPYLRRLLGLHAGEERAGYAEWSSACLAGRRYLRITPQGRVTPCPYIPEEVGELRAQPLAKIWNESPVLARLRCELPAGKCGVCDYRYSCGGCRARALARHGDLLAEDSKCPYRAPPGVTPEASPPVAVRAAVRWAPEAEARLQRIPAFLRGRIRTRLEEHARNEDVVTITAAFMAAHRPAGIPSARR